MENILADLNVATAIAAIVGAGSFIVALGFTAWACDIVASFFEDEDDDNDNPSEVTNQRAVSLGIEFECEECGCLLGGDEGARAIAQGECPACGSEP